MDNDQIAQLIRDCHVDTKTELRRIHERLDEKADKDDHKKLETRVRGAEQFITWAKGVGAAASAAGSALAGHFWFRG